MLVKKAYFIYSIFGLVAILGFQVINEPETGIFHEGTQDTIKDFDTLSYIYELDSLRLFTTNNEDYKYSIYYSSTGEGFYSIEYFFDSSFNFTSYYVEHSAGGYFYDVYSVFENDKMKYLIDSAGMTYQRFHKDLKEFKGLKIERIYGHINNKYQIKEKRYTLLTKLDFEKRESEIVDELDRKIRLIERYEEDFKYYNIHELKFKNKFVYGDTVQMTPFEKNITNIFIDSLLYTKIMDNTFKY